MKKFTLIPHERYLQYQSLLDKQTATPSKQEEVSNGSANTVTDGNTTQVIDNARSTEKLSIDDIISQLPRRNKSKAQSLLCVVGASPRLDWNDKGELLLDNNRVPFTHITDLLHDALNNTRHEPAGLKEFYSGLSNVPQSLVTNPKRRLLIGGKSIAPTIRQLPPPGIPDKKPIPLNNWQTLWKKY